MTTTHWEQLVREAGRWEKEHFLAQRVHALRTPGEMSAIELLLIVFLFIIFANFVRANQILFLSRSNFDHDKRSLISCSVNL